MKYITKSRINVRTIRKLTDGQGLTLRNGRMVEYKTGWQVAYTGVECKTPEEVSKLIHGNTLFASGNVGVWYENSIYYVDYSRRINTKKRAVEIGNACDQISIYSWNRKKMPKLVYLK